MTIGSAAASLVTALAGQTSLESLMERYVDGDRAAFDQLFIQLRPLLVGSLRRWLKSNDQIDEALQLTLIKLHNSRARYRLDAPVLPWVMTIARNVALDLLRSKHRREQSLSDQMADRIASEEPDEPWSPEDEQEVVNAVRVAVDQLPPSAREVIRLHKIDGRPMSEVAEILGIREGAARVRAHRGYKLLAKLLIGFRATRLS